jgi:epsilon-lactone hydrolase
MVARLVASDMRTPHELPDPAALAKLRALEAVTTFEPPSGVTVSELDADGVPGIWIEASGSDSSRVVLFFHGGGYIFMSSRSHGGVVAALSHTCRASVAAVDYRRAPEHPFPAPVDDALTAYRWLLRSFDASRVVLAGDSAGGGLVIAALLGARDEGLPMPAAGICFSPWTDLAVTGASADEADDPVVDGEALRMMATAYLSGADATTPTASPLYGDLRGLPPLHVQVGTRESLLDDSRRFVARAKDAGVDVTLVAHQDVIHMWIVFDPHIPESEEAFRLAGDFVIEHVP